MVADPAPILLFAYGNISRGDDALAPLLVQRLLQHRTDRICGHPVVYLSDFQIQVEHVLDMQGCACMILVDAHTRQDAAFSFYRLRAQRDTHYTTHGMSPQTLLYTYRQTLDADPPPSYMLSLAGESFELGQDLSARASSNLELAFEFCQALFSQDSLDYLDQAASTAPR